MSFISSTLIPEESVLNSTKKGENEMLLRCNSPNQILNDLKKSESV